MIRPIRTADDHKAALREIDRIWGAKPGSRKSDRLEVLSILVEDYEGRTESILKVDPISALKFRMEQAGYTQSDLAKLIGSRGRASEILNGKREMSKAHIRLISSAWGIPVESLL